MEKVTILIVFLILSQNLLAHEKHKRESNEKIEDTIIEEEKKEKEIMEDQESSVILAQELTEHIHNKIVHLPIGFAFG